MRLIRVGSVMGRWPQPLDQPREVLEQNAHSHQPTRGPADGRIQLELIGISFSSTKGTKVHEGMRRIWCPFVSFVDNLSGQMTHTAYTSPPQTIVAISVPNALNNSRRVIPPVGCAAFQNDALFIIAKLADRRIGSEHAKGRISVRWRLAPQVLEAQ